jgi:flagellar assembly protein FliH
MFDDGYTVVPLGDVQSWAADFQVLAPLPVADRSAAPRPDSMAPHASDRQFPGGIGYDDGFCDGLAESKQRYEDDRAAFLKLLASADALSPDAGEELALLIGEAVLALVADIVGQTGADPAWLAQQAKAAADIVRKADEARTLWLHPDDAALIEGIELPLVIMADPAAVRGSIRIDCSNGWIEAGVPIYLDALRAELGLSEVSA